MNLEFPPERVATVPSVPVQTRALMRPGRPPKQLRSYPNRIRALREEQELTLEKLAARAGMGSEKLRKLELGDRELSVADLEAVARALNRPSSQLLTSVDPVLDQQERALLALFRAAGAADRERLLSAAPAILGTPLRKAVS